MLTLMRRAGESIKLSCGDLEITITIERLTPKELVELTIGPDNAYMELKAIHPIKLGKYVANMTVMSIGVSQTQLSFEAPEEISILREELCIN